MLNQTPTTKFKAGDLDHTFGVNGTSILAGENVMDIVVLKTPGSHQGKIVGVLRDGNEFKLFRLEKNGLLDTTFANDGYLHWGFASSPTRSIPTGITELGGDKLLVTGYIYDTQTLNYPAVARFNSSGSIDPTFGSNGVFIFKEPVPVTQQASTAAEQTEATASVSVITSRDDRILVCFNSRSLRPYLNHGLLFQLTSAGQLDPRFNQKGYSFFQYELQNTSSVGLVARENGNILIAGNAGNNGFMAEFTETGEIHTEFGTEGFVLLEAPGVPLRLTALLLQPDNKPVAVGWFPMNSYVKGYVARTLADGKKDSSFNGGAPLIIERQFQSYQFNSATLDSRQAIIVAGEHASRKLGLVGRATTEGRMDNIFGIDGLTDTAIEGVLNFTNSVATQDDNIVTAGQKAGASALTRYHG